MVGRRVWRESVCECARSFLLSTIFKLKCHCTVYIVPKHTKWRIWKVENPYFAIEKSLHIQQMTMWYAMSNHRIIGHIFVDITVTSVRYMKVLEIDLKLWFHSHYRKWLWFRQDVVNPRRISIPLDQQSVWCRGGALCWPHSSSGVPIGHWNGTLLTVIFFGSEHMWLIYAGLH